MRTIITFVVFLCFVWPTAASSKTLPEIPFSIYKHEQKAYVKFIAGRDVYDIDFYGGQYARRDIVERVLIQQAIWFGGYEHTVKWFPVQNYSHGLQKLASGRVALMGTPSWLSDLNKDKSSYLITDPIINKNDFLVGIYTSPYNRDALKAKTLDEILALSITSTRYWFVDWRTVKVLGFNRVVESRSWVDIVGKVSKMQADITLAPFEASPDMKIDFFGQTLVPIRDIRVALHDSRHYAVSKAFPDSENIHKAIQKGFRLMRAQGRIKRAYVECGFYHPDTQSWPVLNDMVRARAQLAQ
ncbi:hypothetical protein HR060_12760 [Catenovulum sp. SM1970]|uniref:hypothetical protein n=1 Tax=Marinifaba aquimaris TaxID=2741323 RepID=UPI001573CB7A|nr:hypothetical protein [Marinifaba aquimaris]NTS77732.1 hypothetical protein [Marinifaba aquimaris]